MQRLVSVVYADLAGFTSRSHGVDPAEVRALQRPFHDRVRAEIERCGGRVEKFIGDAVVAVFGTDDAPDAAERAVRAALRIPQLVSELNDAEPRLALSVRVGVNSDWLSADEAAVVGDVVNVAGFVQSAAPLNGVAVSQPTYEATGESVEYERLAAISLPGQVAPAPLWRARSCVPGDAPAIEVSLAADGDEAPEEKRVVSILFADLVDFSLRSYSGDAAELRALLGPYFGAVKREIERFGGTVEKFVGDAIMAVFGAPVAREDDAERAVRAALRLPDVVLALDEDDAFREVAVRAAVNSGEVVVALGASAEQGEGIVTGDTVNTAARLLGVAPVGGVVVGDATRAATEQSVDYEALEPVTVKGKPEPIAVYRARSIRREVEVAHALRDAPLVARGAELSLLKGTFARVLYERSTQVVILSGTAGAGKSRLVFEFRDYVGAQREPVHWRRGRSRRDVGLSALADAVADHAGVLASDDAEEATAKVAASVRAVSSMAGERERLVAALAALLGAGAGEADFGSCSRFLELVAAQRPLVCVFEDLDTADDGLLAFVEYVADAGRRTPLLLVCTAEASLYERSPGWAGGRPNVTHVQLEPLSDDETARLLTALLGAPPPEALVTACSGNPLYAVEAARARRTDAPGSLEEVLAARLGALPPEQSATLADAAVVGTTFWAGAVATLAAVSAQEACGLLDALAAMGYVRAEPVSTVRGEPEYSFTHPLVREAALALVPAETREGKRRVAAAWFADVGERAARLAPAA